MGEFSRMIPYMVPLLAISFDPLHLIGIVFLAYVASLAGNIVAGIIVGFHTPSSDGQKGYLLVGLAMMALGMTIPKIVIALIGSCIAMATNDTVFAATLWAMGISATIGFLFTLVAGRAVRKSI